ncbi:MAG: sulfatase-like hydrolase/transferase, partial [Candidatus Sumerlaeota bacterium]
MNNTNGFNRRNFCKLLGLGAAAMPFASIQSALAQTPEGERPNILWLVSEDNSPMLGCYGDNLARTPNIDKLASEGILFRNCHSGAPVCAPARCTLITGMEPSAIQGALPMRSGSHMPEGAQSFPSFLKASGYYCTNNAKTDYNIRVDMDATWHESSNKAHYKNRRAGQPFFAVFNTANSHE